MERHVSVGMAKFLSSLKREPKLKEYIDKLSANRTFDLTKARNELGFEPQTDYEKGISEMVENYKKSKEQQEQVT